MDFERKVIVVTGAASGIGKALAAAFVQEGATVVASDRNVDLGAQEAAAIGARFIPADVGQEAGVKGLIDDVLAHEGRIDLLCSNAGIAVGEGPDTPDRVWDLIQRVNVMSHVWAARHVLPHMLERGDGYLLNTASAAGLLTELHSAPYAVTKHAALAFAEWLSITYGDRGIKVAALCPEGVWTPMIQNAPLLQQTAITTDELVAKTLEVLRADGFLITTHPSTLKGFQLKAADYDGWIGKMRHLRGKAMALLHAQQDGAEAGEASR
ncbi:SDR family oxidoreductase [Deinococcus soli (ex Cha et al. 2016)]|jgi:NAD(P)-dependent dehydrogenase (short-subunit alcohol dehydrogenase family)|uniref:SDR family oxidoreductase n=1 Tax=Deinococcus soli (ex Cha et al. 2016) TaxID=1309411 RepID=UPI001662B321|nr:SDR family oxidoreductase [Deinococcus soli (ex Cha et al. 2016)]GGB68502.1 short-chain dehydrogenase [Deinococcus soli (ex Cha et al. 2016)]